MEWIEQDQDCPLCGGTRYESLGTRGGNAHHLRRGRKTQIVRCQQCHGVYPRPKLLPEGNPYEEHSSEDYFHNRDAMVRVQLGVALAKRAAELTGGPGRLLEIGCGRGEILRGAAQAGWQVRGVDMTAQFVDQAKEIEIEQASVDSASSLAEQWECILMPAILEHLYDPVSCLRRVAGALSAGGVVFITVPNECSLWSRTGNMYQRLRGRRWAVNLSPTFPPYHVVGFCPRSLRRVVEGSGLEIIELRTHRWKNKLPGAKGLLRRLEEVGSQVVLTMGHWVSMGVGIKCWARRPDGGSVC